jgi:hypothetical protein
MESTYFIYPKGNDAVNIAKFHNCTWEFNNDSALVEFGMEIDKDSVNGKNVLELLLYIPWLTKKCEVVDLFSKLKEPANSKFVFNDSVTNSATLDGGDNNLGTIHTFSGKGQLCLLPIVLAKDEEKVELKIDLMNYNAYQGAHPNIYVRFFIKPAIPHISMRKPGIAKSTVIYDVKLNERRNIPEQLKNELNTKPLCEIKQCFCFNILPVNYDVVFFDSGALKNVRNLEYDSFKKYIGDERVKKDELMVIFNKKTDSDAYSFFSIYAKERIGIAQFSLAILLNTFCGTLFFIASFRYFPKPGTKFLTVLLQLPKEVYFASVILALTLVYFLWPWLRKIPQLFKRGK